jgi:hypothetical protein
MPKHGVPDSDDTGAERVRESVRNRPHQENPGRQAGRVASAGGDGAEVRLIGPGLGGALFAILAVAASCITPRLRTFVAVVPGCLAVVRYVPVVSLGLRDLVHR